MKCPDAAAASGMITRSVPPARASTLPPTPCHAVHRSTSVKMRRPWAAKRRSTSTVAFRHGSFTDEAEEGQVAYVWGQVMVQLKRYVETGVAAPVFVNS